jgi:acyl-[acyl-carrier-protein]-phospholipid O-acyltransferase/long-chain-fatty-acid--[acyl-carrier-protein] ligase
MNEDSTTSPGHGDAVAQGADMGRRVEDRLKDPGFRALFWTQLLSAFNDNLYKMIVSLLAVDVAAAGSTGGYLSLASIVFMVPYLVFSGYAGTVADMFDKRRVLVVGKAMEIAVMALALGAMVSRRIELLLAVLFLLAVQATFLSPAKYGILPEVMPPGALQPANAMLETSRYVAVILGTVFGGLMLSLLGDSPVLIGIFLIAVAAGGFAVALRISSTQRSAAATLFRFNPWGGIAGGVRRLAANSRLGLAVAGITYFEALGALVMLDMILVGKETMGLDDAWMGLLCAFAGIGIGAGSMVAGRLSFGRIELGMVPIGGIGVGVALLGLSTAAGSYAWTAGWLVAMGALGGLFYVPLNAALQDGAADSERGLVIATNNFLNMSAVLLASGLLWVLRDVLDVSPEGILLLCGLLTLAVMLGALRRFPTYAASAVSWAGRVADARRR